MFKRIVMRRSRRRRRSGWRKKSRSRRKRFNQCRKKRRPWRKRRRLESRIVRTKKKKGLRKKRSQRNHIWAILRTSNTRQSKKPQAS